MKLGYQPNQQSTANGFARAANKTAIFHIFLMKMIKIEREKMQQICLIHIFLSSKQQN